MVRLGWLRSVAHGAAVLGLCAPCAGCFLFAATIGQPLFHVAAAGEAIARNGQIVLRVRVIDSDGRPVPDVTVAGTAWRIRDVNNFMVPSWEFAETAVRATGGPRLEVELADVFEARLAVSKPGYFDTTVHVRLDDSPRNNPSPDAPPADLFVTQRYMDRPAKVLDRPVEVVMVRGTQEPLHRVAGGLRATPRAPGCFFSLSGVSGPGDPFAVDPLFGPRVPLAAGATVYFLADAGPDGGLMSAESWPGETWARTPHRVRLCVTGGAGSGVVPVAGARSLADLAEAPADGYQNGLVLGPAFFRDAPELPGGGGRVLCFYVRHAAGSTVTYGKGRVVFLPDREHVRGEAVLYSRDDGRRGLSTRPGRGE